MNNLIQMLMNQKMKQIPQGMMNKMEQQLKRVNPQAYQEFQEARKNNIDPNEYLNKITSNFSNEQQQKWNSMFNNGINVK